ncbi:hypothetical protein HYX00_04945 [Candidatus Woesearchaeota archaeon]|nr:hypothetical protein [Candidatus Woesearchaeota archaeon]
MKPSLKKENESDYEYEIYVENKLAWHGLNPKKVYEKLIKENPNKKVSIAWELKEGILIGNKALDLFHAYFNGNYTDIKIKS